MGNTGSDTDVSSSTQIGVPLLGTWLVRATWVTLVATGAVSCGQNGSDGSVAGSSPSRAASVEAGDLGSPRPVADHSEPAVRAGAAGRLVSCDGPVHLGGWSSDFGGPGGSLDAEHALERFLQEGLFEVPTMGYRQAGTDEGRVLFTYDVDGEPKVAVIVADTAVVDAGLPFSRGWAVETVATCDPAEYDPSADDELVATVWTDVEGNRVPTTIVRSFQGHEHCDWQSVTFLSLEGVQYLRDPQHRLTDLPVAPYDGDVELPTDAVDTGYRRGGDELWLAANESIAYVVTDAAVEAWPSTTDTVACA